MDELGAQLDFLSKELVRLQEERRIQAFVMLAERERRMREAEESGRRQTEERRRRTEDEMIKQIMKVHQNTVDGYLQDVLMHSVQETADEKARERIQHLSMQVINSPLSLYYVANLFLLTGINWMYSGTCLTVISLFRINRLSIRR